MKIATIKLLDKNNNEIDSISIKVRTTIKQAANTAWNIYKFKYGNEPHEIKVEDASLIPLFYKKEDLN